MIRNFAINTKPGKVVMLSLQEDQIAEILELDRINRVPGMASFCACIRYICLTCVSAEPAKLRTLFPGWQPFAPVFEVMDLDEWYRIREDVLPRAAEKGSVEVSPRVALTFYRKMYSGFLMSDRYVEYSSDEDSGVYLKEFPVGEFMGALKTQDPKS